MQLKWTAIFLPLMVSCAAAGAAENGYTSWGVDEYEFFALTKPELEKKFKGKLTFDSRFEKAYFGTQRGCQTYLGPTFLLSYANGKVVRVQGNFEGCKVNCPRPQFDNKKDALLYAVKGLATSSDAKDAKKLQAAQSELRVLEESARAKASETKKHPE